MTKTIPLVGIGRGIGVYGETIDARAEFSLGDGNTCTTATPDSGEKCPKAAPQQKQPGTPTQAKPATTQQTQARPATRPVQVLKK